MDFAKVFGVRIRLKTMLIALFILLTFTLIYVLAKLRLASQFEQQVKDLFGQSKSISQHKFDVRLLDGLPPPVQLYFKHVLKIGQPFISYISLTHDGQFKPGLDKNWLNITGEQYFTTEKPGFIWKGTTWMFVARDMYIGDKGRLLVLLFSLFKVADGQGEHYNEGELQRWLVESVWFPTNLLPSERIKWTAIDSHTAQLNFKYENISFYFKVNFNGLGEIIQMSTQRFISENNRENWICRFSDYRLRSEVLIPTTGEVMWRLAKGDVSYAKFKVKTIKYN
jgi:hypothetical protein